MDIGWQLVAQQDGRTAGSVTGPRDEQPRVIRRVSDIEALARELRMAELVARARHLRRVLEHVEADGRARAPARGDPVGAVVPDPGG